MNAERDILNKRAASLIASSVSGCKRIDVVGCWSRGELLPRGTTLGMGRVIVTVSRNRSWKSLTLLTARSFVLLDKETLVLQFLIAIDHSQSFLGRARDINDADITVIEL